MDFNSSNNKADFLWSLLENPANDASIYTYDLRRLVDEFPQSGVLQALLAHASDEKNLKRASAYFSPRALFKLINAPLTFTGIPGDRIFIQPGISLNGVHPVNEIPVATGGSSGHTGNYNADELVVDRGAPVMEPVAEASGHIETGDLTADHGAEEYLSHFREEHTPGLVRAEDVLPVVATDHTGGTITDPVYEEIAPELHDHATNSFEETAPVASIVEGGIGRSEEIYAGHEYATEAENSLTEGHTAAEGPSHQVETAYPESGPAPNIWANEEMPPVPGAIAHHAEDIVHEIEPACVRNIDSEDIHQATPGSLMNEAPAAEFEQHMEEQVQAFDLPEEYQTEPVAEIPAAKESIPEQERTEPAEEMEETYDEIVSIEDIRIDEHSTGSFFTFDQEFGAHEDELPEKANEKEVIETQQGTGHQDVSQYHDEKMPYTFLWWLDKTRKEHAQIYQPYTRPPANPGKKSRKTIDTLQQQYIENIFHINSVEELDKSTPSSPVTPDLKKKEQHIIDRFIREEPQIKPQSSDKLDNENKARKSSEDRDELVTETLAGIYTDQMLYHKAISSYKKLMLKFPEKSRYFAGKIEQLEKKTN